MKQTYLLSFLLLAATLAGAKPPNILIILADDLGYADLSIQGCKQYETPAIDSIARQGIRFTQGYVCNSVCAPSRAGLMTGRIGVGFEANLPPGDDGMDTRLETMPAMLQKAGYFTACIGKWHLGKLEEQYPTNRGFDYFFGLRGGARSYWHDPDGADAPGRPSNIERNGSQVSFDGYLTDVLTDEAIDVITTHQRQSPDQPFFMYLSYTAPHHPMDAKPEILETLTHIEQEKRRAYAAMTVSLDEGVGRVLDTLRAENIYSNTLVVFFSDNGGPTDQNASWNGMLKGKKGDLWEGGVRVPFLVQWPERVQAGQVLDTPVWSLDLTPTFAAVAGTEPVEKADGINLVPHLTGDVTNAIPRDFVWRRATMVNCAVRSGDFKWVMNRRAGMKGLYNLVNDIGEMENLIDQEPDLAASLEQVFLDWETSSMEPLFNENWKPDKP